MGYLSSAFERRASLGSTISLTENRDPALAAYFGGGINTASSQNVNAITALKISTVFACVHRKASTLAMIPLYTMKGSPDGSAEKAIGHRTFRQVGLKPNSWQSSFDWRYMGQTHKMLRGNFYNLIVYNPGRQLNELIPLHPDRVWVYAETPTGEVYYLFDNSPPPPVGSKIFYQYFPINAQMKTFAADEILHVRGISENGIVGKSVVKLMAESVGLAMATEQQGATLFTNGAQISKVFTHPTKMSDETFERLKKELGQYTGAENAHRTIILEDGMKIEKLSLTMEEAQFLETRKFQVEDICSFLDVPMMLINRSGDKNQTFASAEVIMQMFITLNMQPEFRNWEERLQIDLLYDSESSYFFKFDFDELMRGDSKARAEFAKAMFETGAWTPNDIRRKNGENPRNDDVSDLVYASPGVMPIETMIKNAENKQPVEPSKIEKPVEEPSKTTKQENI